MGIPSGCIEQISGVGASARVVMVRAVPSAYGAYSRRTEPAAVLCSLGFSSCVCDAEDSLSIRGQLALSDHVKGVTSNV